MKESRNKALLLNHEEHLIGIRRKGRQLLLLTATEMLHSLGYSNLRHIYWLVEKGHLPRRKFGRELVFTEDDRKAFMKKRREKARGRLR